MSVESPLQMVKKAYSSAIRLAPDDMLTVDCFMGVLTAAFTPRLDESVWMYWIAPPASGKTLTVNPAREHPRIMMLSTPTENALMSGYTDEDGKDPSLIPLLDGKVLIWKDFTALMDAGPRLVDKVAGEFRDAYDHHCSKASGASGVRQYTSRFGMIACVTDRIDAFVDSHQQLGERFLSFRMNRIQESHEDRVKNLRYITDSMLEKRIWSDKLQKAVHSQIDRILLKCDSMKTPTISAGALTDVEVMADLLALTRTSCSDTASRAELDSRIVQQLINLGHAHAIADFRDSWNETEMVLIRRILEDSLSSMRKRFIQFMFSRGPNRPAVTKKQLLDKCGTSMTEINRTITQYLFSSVIEAVDSGMTDECWYRLTPSIYKSLSKVGVFK